MLEVRALMGKQQEPKKHIYKKLRLIPKERLIRFLEACFRKLNKPRDQETIRLLKQSQTVATNTHYKSKFENISKKQKTWHAKRTQKASTSKTKTGSVIRKDQQRWATGDEADATPQSSGSGRGGAEAPAGPRASTFPISPGGVGVGTSYTSLDSPTLGPDWLKIGLNEYQRSIVNKQSVVSRKHIDKNM